MIDRILPRTFYDRDVQEVARDLLGQRLVRVVDGRVRTGWIVETEAYRHANDPASHSFRGRTRRNASMFGPPGTAYVYTIHARFCLNAVAEGVDRGAAVLIRAVEPESGIQDMVASRGTAVTLDLARGPARLCEAFELDRNWDGWDLTRGDLLWIEQGLAIPAAQVGVSGRIGIRDGADLPLRFFLAGNRFVSGPRKWHGREVTQSLGARTC